MKSPRTPNPAATETIDRREDQGKRDDPDAGSESFDYSNYENNIDKKKTMDPWIGAEQGGRTGQSALGDAELESPERADETTEEEEGDTFEPHSWSGGANPRSTTIKSK